MPMLLSALSAVAALSFATPPAPLAPDTTRYPVLNHGRLAGEMVVIRDGSSVVVRYIYVDRNRGQRIEMRYRLSPSGDVIASERRTIGADGVAGEPTFRYEVAGDSARVTGPSANGPFTRVTKAEPGQFFRTGGIPFDDALLAYRCWMMRGLAVWLFNSTAYHSESAITAAVSRFASAIVDHDVFRLLDV